MGQLLCPVSAAHRLLQLRGRHLLLQDLPELPQHRRIGQRPMTSRHVQLVTLDQGIEAVLAELRKQLARQLHRAQHRGLEVHAHALELVLQETIVKARVVRHEQASMQAHQHLFGQLLERGRLGHHRIG